MLSLIYRIGAAEHPYHLLSREDMKVGSNHRTPLLYSTMAGWGPECIILLFLGRGMPSPIRLNLMAEHRIIRCRERILGPVMLLQERNPYQSPSSKDRRCTIYSRNAEISIPIQTRTSTMGGTHPRTRRKRAITRTRRGYYSHNRWLPT